MKHQWVIACGYLQNNEYLYVYIIIKLIIKTWENI